MYTFGCDNKPNSQDKKDMHNIEIFFCWLQLCNQFRIMDSQSSLYIVILFQLNGASNATER